MELFLRSTEGGHNIFSRNSGIFSVAIPWMNSWKAAEFSGGSRFMLAVCAPALRATAAKPAAGYTLPLVPIETKRSQLVSCSIACSTLCGRSPNQTISGRKRSEQHGDSGSPCELRRGMESKLVRDAFAHKLSAWRSIVCWA